MSPTLTEMGQCPTKVGGIAPPQSKLEAHAPAAPSSPATVKQDLLPSVMTGQYCSYTLRWVLVLAFDFQT